jgi:Fe2+ transport system protein FeoA
MTSSFPALRTLSSLAPGESGVVDHLETSGAVLYKLMELGVWPGEKVTLVRRAPFGDPLVIELMGYQLALRELEAGKIFLI